MYTPKVPPILQEEFLPYLLEELDKIALELNSLIVGEHQILYKEPLKIRPGMVVYADGVQWNPGSGEGLYRYSLGGSWVHLG